MVGIISFRNLGCGISYIDSMDHKNNQAKLLYAAVKISKYFFFTFKLILSKFMKEFLYIKNASSFCFKYCK